MITMPNTDMAISPHHVNEEGQEPFRCSSAEWNTIPLGLGALLRCGRVCCHSSGKFRPARVKVLNAIRARPLKNRRFGKAVDPSAGKNLSDDGPETLV